MIINVILSIVQMNLFLRERFKYLQNINIETKLVLYYFVLTIKFGIFFVIYK